MKTIELIPTYNGFLGIKSDEGEQYIRADLILRMVRNSKNDYLTIHFIASGQPPVNAPGASERMASVVMKGWERALAHTEKGNKHE